MLRSLNLNGGSNNIKIFFGRYGKLLHIGSNSNVNGMRKGTLFDSSISTRFQVHPDLRPQGSCIGQFRSLTTNNNSQAGDITEKDHSDFIKAVLKHHLEISKQNIINVSDVIANPEKELASAIEKNINSSGLRWNRLLSDQELKGPAGGYSRILQIILYNQCLKYSNLKNLSTKLLDNDYLIYSGATDNVTTDKMTYHVMVGRLTTLSSFIAEHYSSITYIDLLSIQGYKHFLRLLTQYSSSGFGLDAACSLHDVHYTFVDTLDTLNATLKDDYDNFVAEVNRINALLKKERNRTDQLTTTKEIYLYAASIAASVGIITGILGLLINRM